MNKVGFVALGAIAQQILSFGVILLITRLLGADGYGEVVTLIAVANTIYCFSAQWATPYVVRTGAVSFAQSHKIGNEFTIPAIISLMVLLISTYLFTHYFSTVLGNISTIPAAMIYLSAISYLMFQIAKNSLQIQNRFGYYGMLLSLDKLLLLLFLCVLLLMGSLTKSHVLWAYVAGTLCAGVAGLTTGLYKKFKWWTGDFRFREYIKSVAPISVSVVIFYFSSITFLILISRASGGFEYAAWIGMGSVILGVLMQPVNWLAPTLTPRLSTDVLEVDSHVRIALYLQDWVLSITAIVLWLTVCAIMMIIYTPVLPLLLGNGFDGGGKVIALVVTLTVAEVANLMLVQLVYACKLEKIVLLAVFCKALPLLIGYAIGASGENLLVLMNLGGWIAIVVSLFGVRRFLNRQWVFQYTALGVIAFIVSIVVVIPNSTWYLELIFFILTLIAIVSIKQLFRAFKVKQSKVVA